MLIKTEDFFEDISNDVEKWFDTSNYDEDDKRPILIGKNKKVICLFKDELGGKIMKEFVGLGNNLNWLLKLESDLRDTVDWGKK